jgi:hypothetical protein
MHPANFPASLGLQHRIAASNGSGPLWSGLNYIDQGIITEFGVDDARWLELMDRLLAYLAQESIPWTFWVGGPGGAITRFSTERKKGKDASVISVLTKDYEMPRKRSSP